MCVSLQLWKLPEEGLKGPMSEPAQQYAGFDGGVSCVKFHPSAANIVGVTNRTGMSLINLDAGAVVRSWQSVGAGQDALSGCFSVDGSTMAVVCKDQITRWVDARSPADAQMKTMANSVSFLRPAEAIPLSATDNTFWMILVQCQNALQIPPACLP
jgi:hypothetical protein